MTDLSIGALIVTRNGEGRDSRFPGKGMANLYGKPTNYWVFKPYLDAVENNLMSGPIVAAIPGTEQSQVLTDYLRKLGVSVHMGSTVDIVERLCEAILRYPTDYYFFKSGDVPFFDSKTFKTTLQAVKQHPGHRRYGFTGSLEGSWVEGFSCGGFYARRFFTELKEAREATNEDWYKENREMFSLPESFDVDTNSFLVPSPYEPPPKQAFKLSIDYPIELATANLICKYLGKFPETIEEIEHAYKNIHSF
ncbi:hypothetical protein KAR91_24575 [Candidatus Pacearchaeota archaeon]|nr:hypothetical protein [Candidatus Pacearchaeota archaeon]